MKIRQILALLAVIVLPILPFTGCKEIDKAFDEAFFGSELYNASYVYLEGETVEHIIPLMSKIDLSDLESVHEISEGADYTMTFKTESYEKTVGEYRLYKIILSFSDIVFKNDKLKISEIQITTATGERYVIAPNKCEIVPLDGRLNQDYININGAPLRIPMDMMYIPLELSKDTPAEDNLTVKGIRLTNDDMSMYYYQHSDGSESDQFKEFLLNGENDIKTWKAMFEIKDDNREYMQYGTSIIVEYEYDGQVYVAVPAIVYSIYNPFDINYESIDLYCAQLGVK